MKKILKNLAALGFGLLLSLIVLEVFLRVVDPFQISVRGGNVVLHRNQQRRYVWDGPVEKLDQEIRYTTNELGLRGPEKPENVEEYLSIITVGGSTTECWFNGDEKTWPYLLGQRLSKDFDRVWVNNAGISGQTTYGHIQMLREHLLKLQPRVILFLAGVNDMGYWASGVQGETTTLRGFLLQHSEIVNVGFNLWRTYLARARHVSHGKIKDFSKYSTLVLPEAAIEAAKERQREEFLGGYRDRVLELVDLCRRNGIEPILVTQPLAWGEGVDPATSFDLETMRIDDETNSRLQWEVMELYNDVLRETGRDEGVHVVDLAAKLPKDTRYFYDFVHFSNLGTAEVAKILDEDLTRHFRVRYPEFVRHGSDADP
ncbi:MAG: SGNH/GDSL hydrolase family protein [Acidobacteriota bacterium]